MSVKQPQALRLIGPRRFKLETMQSNKAPEGGLLCEVLRCAICGTDLKIYRGDKKVRCDILGHEFVAKILQVSSGVESFEVGQIITVVTTISCGHCYYCINGLTNICENAVRMGLDFPGAFADVIEIPPIALQRGNVLKVPKALPSDLVVLAEPLSCVLNGQQIAGMRAGLDVLVIGGGPIGILHVLAARHCGARRIILSEINTSRLKLAESFGVNVSVNPTKQDLVAEVKAQTDGLGVDVVFVCSPASKSMHGLTDMVKKRGMINIFAGLSVDDSKFLLDGRAIHYRELSITGASDSRGEHFMRAFHLLEAFGDSFRPVITHCLPLNRAAEAFEILEKGEGLKVVLVPGEPS